VPELPGQISIFDVLGDDAEVEAIKKSIAAARRKHGDYELPEELLTEARNMKMSDEICECTYSEKCHLHRKHNEPIDSPARVRNTHNY
jgi:hypothetical protein